MLKIYFLPVTGKLFYPLQYTYTYPHPFALESGAVLPELHIAYHSYGKLNREKNNVIWICHALTANAGAADWWSGLVGEGKVMDSGRYFIVCANIPGSCYGSSGPLTADPASGKPYYSRFPQVTIRDMVKAHILLGEHLGVERIHMLAGGSMGGYQALEWALAGPRRIERLFLLATGAA